jgi:predicted regulator of Ras-like GTPase activity (Roadblock/LC7/MglB family)
MPYQRLLEGLVAAVGGAEAALMLDATGEVVVEAGERSERQRLIGAYQGLVLDTARRALWRAERGTLRLLVGRYRGGAVVLRPLKDGYYLVLSLGPEASVALAVQRSAETQERVDREL